MGQGGHMVIVNATDTDWNKTYDHSYQMNSWDFPDTIKAGTVANVYVEWKQGLNNEKDDAGEATYTLANTDNVNFQVQARASNGFVLQVAFLNLETQGNPVGTVLNLGWELNGYVNFLLTGSEGNYVSTNLPSANWMTNNLSLIGSHPLEQISMPGTHDSGMSVISGGTAFGFKCNTITQTNDILGQLNLGARYFDIRPVISGGDYYTGHYGYISQIKSYQGANGESIASVISNVNDFTASNNELVVLNLSHDYNTDTGNSSYQSFTQAEWDALFEQLSGIEKLYSSGDVNTDFTKLSLNDLIKDDAAVLVIVESDTDLGSYGGNGFYPYSSFNAYNKYADTNSLTDMSSDQISKMDQETGQQYFLLSWTLTQDSTQAATCETGLAKSILDLASEADQSLSRLLFPAVSSSAYPNIIYTDDITDTQQAALAMAVNYTLLGTS